MDQHSSIPKIVTIILVVAILIGIGVAAMWWFLLRDTAPIRPPVQPGIGGPAVDIPFPDITPAATDIPDENVAVGPPGDLSQPILVQLTDFAIIGPSLNKDETKILFYKKDGGDLISSAFDQPLHEQIANLTIIGLVDALWSPARDRAALFYTDQNALRSFLHIGESTIATLPQNIITFSWSPNGKELAYLVRSEDSPQSSLAIAASSGNNQKTISTIPLVDADISWVTSALISFQTKPSGLAPGSLYTFSRSTHLLNRAVGPLNGLQALWSQDGTLVMIASTNGKGQEPKLSIYDAKGDLKGQNNAVTLPEKCVWVAAKELICGVAESLPAGAIFPDDYLRGEITTHDRLVLFDFTSKESSYLLSQSNFDITHPIITKNKEYLFFINRADGTLWSLRLKNK